MFFHWLGDPVAKWFADGGEIYLDLALIAIATFCLFVAFSRWPPLAKAGVAVWLLMP